MAFHFQDTVNGWTTAIEKLPDDSLIKAVDRGDILRTVKQLNPNIKTVLRHWYDQNQHFGGTVEDNRNRARQFFATWIDGTFRDQYAEYVDFVLEFNEYLASSHTGAELDDRLSWAEAVAWVWANEYRTQADYEHIRLALLSVPVGNDIDRRFAEIADEYDCILSYHAYDKYLSGERDPGSWRYHCGRWHFMEQAWGDLKPEWMFGEAGPYASVTGGWRDEKVLGGDREAYVEAVRRWIREIKTTTAYAEGRVLGFNLFTTARAGGVFDLYRTEQPELNMLAEMVAEEWTPVELPEPEPEPLEAAIWDASVREQIERGIPLNPNALLQSHILDGGFTPVHRERRFRGGDGTLYAYQGAETVDASEPRRVYHCVDNEDGSYGPVSWFGEPGEEEDSPFEFSVWPTVEKRVTQRFGANPETYQQFGLKGHEGVDLAAPFGTPYFCVAPGEVIWVSDRRRSNGQPSNYGWHVIIDHGNGWTTLFAHAEPEPPVSVGDRVEAGDVVATSGNTGFSSGAHLHLTVKRDGHQLPGWPAGYVNPETFLEPYEPAWP